MNRNNPIRSRARGFTLVEAMVAMVILSIGMLGIAALYVESLSSGRTALLRTEAIVLATDMADRIRANPQPGAAGANYIKAVSDAGTMNAACGPGGGGCTPAQMAAYDIAVWHQAVDDRADDPSVGRLALPGGRGSITVVPIAGTNLNTYTITVTWIEAGQVAAADHTVVMRVEA